MPQPVEQRPALPKSALQPGSWGSNRSCSGAATASCIVAFAGKSCRGYLALTFPETIFWALELAAPADKKFNRLSLSLQLSEGMGSSQPLVLRISL